ncbi:MAG TPA: T9SS type A sorting domain-containing protein [Verrucomicrobiae bacterium]|nr:T9SS type A sorting domain-containing protein [Verrucomicrobiae bacterium]
MKKFFTLIISIFIFAALAATAVAQPDPQDSIILESKTVDTALTGTGGTSVFFMRVNITNRDSLAFLTLSLRESTVNGTAYVLLNRTAGGTLNFTSMVTPMTGTLRFFGSVNVSQYNDNSPDRFLLAAGFDGSDPSTIEPPNATRKEVWQIRFRHSSGFDSIGIVRFDSTRVANLPCTFTNTVPADLPVNFVAGQCTVLTAFTDVRDVNPGQRPQAYSLSQNYPNPFNANTQISFALPKAGKTTLEIFNILGQKVNTLVDEYLQAKSYIVNWDGRDSRGMEVPSGIYFYRLRSQDFLQTKKMLMIQ